MLAQQGGDVGFENIAVNQPKAVVASETALQDRNQFVVDFHGEHAAGRAEQLLRQRARAGTDLQHAAVGGYAAAGDDFANHRVADEKILAVFFLLAEILRIVIDIDFGIRIRVIGTVIDSVDDSLHIHMSCIKQSVQSFAVVFGLNLICIRIAYSCNVICINQTTL